LDALWPNGDKRKIYEQLIPKFKKTSGRFTNRPELKIIIWIKSFEIQNSEEIVVLSQNNFFYLIFGNINVSKKQVVPK